MMAPWRVASSAGESRAHTRRTLERSPRSPRMRARREEQDRPSSRSRAVSTPPMTASDMGLLPSSGSRRPSATPLRSKPRSFRTAMRHVPAPRAIPNRRPRPSRRTHDASRARLRKARRNGILRRCARARSTRSHSVRGLAALWVVVFHLWNTVVRLLPPLAPLAPLAECGYLAVPFFFVLSGYVLGLRYLPSFAAPSAHDVKRFLFLRLGRIYPVHLLMLMGNVALVARHGWPTDDALLEDPLPRSACCSCNRGGRWRLSPGITRRGRLAANGSRICCSPSSPPGSCAGRAPWSMRIASGVRRARRLRRVSFAPVREARDAVAPTFLGGVVIAQLVRARVAPGARGGRASGAAAALALIAAVVILPLVLPKDSRSQPSSCLRSPPWRLLGAAGNPL